MTPVGDRPTFWFLEGKPTVGLAKNRSRVTIGS